MYIPKSLSIKNLLSHRNTYYEFVQGQPILIVGKNLANAGQVSNGSGKSAFNEAIAIATTGDPLRKMSLKELIFDNETQATIIWTLVNSVTNKELVIERNIHLKKASDCKITLGGVLIEKSNVNEYKAWIFEEFGFSEDDFFNFYLLTLENDYKPFFSLTDTPKKVIINRFSGANRVDDVFPHIEKDLSEKQTSLVKLQQDKAVAEGKKQVLDGLLQEATEFDGSIARKESLDQLDIELNSISVKITNEEELKKELRDEAKELEKQVNELVKNEPNFEDDKNKIKTDLEAATKSIEQLEEKQGKLQTERKEALEKVYEKEKAYNDKKKLELGEVDKVEKIISDTKQAEQIKQSNLKKEKAGLEHQLLEAIECPACKHIFSTKDEDFVATKVAEDIAVLEGKLVKIDTILKQQEEEQKDLELLKEEIQTESKEETSKFDELKAETSNKFSKKIVDIRTALDEEDSKLLKLNNSMRELQEKENLFFKNLSDARKNLQIASNKIDVKRESIKSLEASLESKKAEIAELKSKPLPDQKDKQKEHQTAIDVLNAEISSLNTKIDLNEKEVLDIEIWNNNFKSFKSHLANKSIKNIENHTNLFLQEMKTDLSVEVEGYRMLANKKLKEEISTSILRDGMNGKPYGRFSRGERARIDLSSIIALQELVNVNAKNGGGLDLLIIDEILDCCDPMGIENLFKGLHNLRKTVLIISQNNVKALKEDTLWFIKEPNGETSIVLPSEIEETEEV